ncbi:Anaphase-promoting complex subunit 11 [Trypanosoma melophagium]|uniref:Anaphase-promoting complex subunit 11 n=1 Tax=Trypanosoma melophagium TaxID=715481 RepID=UPI00351A2D64|nr:Anaphase-promoting complex subunit 11 [Trypanosoma melophagium]
MEEQVRSTLLAVAEENDVNEIENRILRYLLRFPPRVPIDECPWELCDEFYFWCTCYFIQRVRGEGRETELKSMYIAWYADSLRLRARDFLSFYMKVFTAMREYPRAAVGDLLTEYHTSRSQQLKQHLAQNKQMAESGRGYTTHENNNNDSDNNSNAASRSSTELQGTMEESTTPPAELPCLEPPDRHNFGDGRVRVAPLYSDDVARVILSHVGMQHLTFLLSKATLRLELSNPMPIPNDIIHGYTCDTCCRMELYVGFQAIAPNNHRSEVRLCAGCCGFDICISCVVYIVYEAFRRLQLALLPPQYKPFSLASVCSLRVQSAVYERENARLRVTLSPSHLRLCVWQLTQSNSVTPSSFAEEFYALPTPPTDWLSSCTVVTPSDTMAHRGKLDDVCSICLLPLEPEENNNNNNNNNSNDRSSSGGDVALVETACHHWFHAECLESARHLSGLEDRCPLCRQPEYMALAARTCSYDVALELKKSPNDVETPVVHIAVAVLIGDVYLNPTNVAACEVIHLACGKITCTE